MTKFYKGFEQDLRCRGFQFEIGKEYREEYAELCNTGFHACENPLDTFEYYEPSDGSRYCEVELDEISDQTAEDTMCCGKVIRIIRELSVQDLCRAHFDYIKSRFSPPVPGEPEAVVGSASAAVGAHGSAAVDYGGSAAAGDGSSASAGNRGIAAAGDRSIAAAGSRGIAAAGDRSLASADRNGIAAAGYFGTAAADSHGTAAAGSFGRTTAGDYGVAAVGERGSAVSGKNSVAAGGTFAAVSAGDHGHALAGNVGSAEAGYRGCAVAGYRGRASAGEQGLACAINGRVKGGLGCVICCAELDEAGNNLSVAAAIVDGEAIKADTWYTVRDGSFVEADA